MTTWEVWDGTSGNCIGVYRTKRAALEGVADAAAREPRAASSLGLIRSRSDEDQRLVASGQELLVLVGQAQAAVPA